VTTPAAGAARSMAGGTPYEDDTARTWMVRAVSLAAVRFTVENAGRPGPPRGRWWRSGGRPPAAAEPAPAAARYRVAGDVAPSSGRNSRRCPGPSRSRRGRRRHRFCGVTRAQGVRDERNGPKAATGIPTDQLSPHAGDRHGPRRTGATGGCWRLPLPSRCLRPWKE
jgi:hypothetical protein